MSKGLGKNVFVNRYLQFLRKNRVLEKVGKTEVNL